MCTLGEHEDITNARLGIYAPFAVVQQHLAKAAASCMNVLSEINTTKASYKDERWRIVTDMLFIEGALVVPDRGIGAYCFLRTP